MLTAGKIEFNIYNEATEQVFSSAYTSATAFLGAYDWMHVADYIAWNASEEQR